MSAARPAVAVVAAVIWQGGRYLGVRRPADKPMLRAVELLRGEIETVFTKVRETDITAAREMLILGTTNDCLSIVRYNGALVGDGTPGPVSKRIKALLTADIAATGVPL